MPPFAGHPQVYSELTNLLAMGFIRYSEDWDALILANGTAFAPIYQAETPVSGATVWMTNNKRDGLLYLNPATNLASLTIMMPPDSTTRLSQVRRIYSERNITDLTVLVPDGGTVMNPGDSMSAGDILTFIKVSNNRWARDV